MVHKRLFVLICSVLLGYESLFAQVSGIQKFSGTPTAAASNMVSASGLGAQDVQKLDPLLRYFLSLTTNNSAAAQAATQSLERDDAALNLEREESGQLMVWVLVKTDNVSATVAEIQKQGGIVTTVAGDILVAKVPAPALGTVTQASTIQRIEACTKSKPLLNTSRTETQANLVHTGSGLPKAYKGSGVIVGIVDSGIDEAHADFKTAAGVSRILYLWDMSGTSNPPSGYTYGREYTKAQIDAGQCFETDDNGHGTHVAGTAAGNGRAKSGYIGIAPEADIVFVKGFRAGSQGFQDNDVINGCSYIFQKAQALGKPAVINLSLGGHYGPHDASSLYEQALSNLTGSGKVIVAAAGNEGNDYIHLSYATSGSGYSDSHETLMKIPAGKTTAIIDIWYPNVGNISVGVAGYNKSTGSGLFTTQAAAPGTTKNFSTNYGNITIDATQTSNSNGAKRVTVILQGADLSTITWSLYTVGSGVFDAWFAVGGGFTTNSSNYLRPGDNNKSVGIPATSEKVICVGAYTTKKQWVNVNGSTITDNSSSVVIGDIAYFSSRGPSRDGRVKPDIAAPGQWIGAALSQDSSPDAVYILQGGKLLMEQGTSMAAPHVTGTVALLLSRNTTLDYPTTLNILRGTAKQDSYTGSTPNNEWGAGKLNAYAAMKALTTSDAGNPGDTKPMKFALEQNYPNPFNPVTTISYTIPAVSMVSLRVYDLLGREVSTLVNERKPSGHYEVSFDAARLGSGIYFYKMTAGSYAETKKMLLVK